MLECWNFLTRKSLMGLLEDNIKIKVLSIFFVCTKFTEQHPFSPLPMINIDLDLFITRMSRHDQNANSIAVVFKVANNEWMQSA